MSRLRRHRYYAADRAASRVLNVLAHTADPTVRAETLHALARWEDTLAEHADAFSDADTHHGQGYTLAESHRAAARLVRLVADTELTLAQGEPRHRTRSDPLTRDPKVTPVLGGLGREHHPSTRAVLLLALHTIVAAEVGTQAAEVLQALAAAYYRLAAHLLQHRSDQPPTA